MLLYLKTLQPAYPMRLRLVFFDVKHPDNHKLWGAVMWGTVLAPNRYTLVMDTKNMVYRPDDTDETILHEVWQYTQNDHAKKHWRSVMAPELKLPPYRSACAGDVVIVDDRVYAIGTIGFTKLSGNQANEFLAFGVQTG